MRIVLQFLLLLFLGSLQASTLFAEPTLKWMDTFSSLSYRNGMPSQSFRARILVKNVCYEKSITFHLESERHPPQILTARYRGPAADGYEVWEAESTLDPDHYRVRVIADLDRPYELSPLQLGPDSGPVLLDGQSLQAWPLPREVRAGERVRVMAASRESVGERVFVHISGDGWKTQQVLPLQKLQEATHGGSLSVRVWFLDLSLPINMERLSYFFSLEGPEGVRYDTNFGHNYDLVFR